MAERLPPKQRMKLARQEMPERDAAERATDFGEVNLGFTTVLAEQEAQRCLECADPKCVRGCPVGVQIRQIVSLVLDGEYLAAAKKLRQDNVLPAVTGRVCPQENQCEGACILGKRFSPLAIGNIERFLADYESRIGETALPDKAPPTGKRVAIVGSGPAALSCAGDLLLKGHDVTVFEALHEIGGVLVYGIPEFRLPKQIVRDEVENLRKLGADFQTNVVVGKTLTIDELLGEEGYDAVFVATGAGLPRFMDIPGEQLGGVYSANEFLTRVNLMKSYDAERYDSPVFDCRDRRVAVVGGGNTAMDAVRAAKRLGAAQATIMYRRSEAEMPARAEELHHAKQEGVEILPLHSPIEFLGDDNGFVTAARLVKMELGEPDDSGRRRARPIPDSEFDLPLDMVVIAIGAGPNPLLTSATPDLAVTAAGYIAVDAESLQTSKRGVFAGGDIVTGAATVILAMGAGRQAAGQIDRFLTDGNWTGPATE